MKPIRVAGTDPGTSSLDVIVLEDGQVVDQVRFSPQEIQADATLPIVDRSTKSLFNSD